MRRFLALVFMVAAVLVAQNPTGSAWMAPPGGTVNGGTINPDTVNARKGVFDTLTVNDDLNLPYVQSGSLLMDTPQGVAGLLCSVDEIPVMSTSGGTDLYAISGGTSALTLGGLTVGEFLYSLDAGATISRSVSDPWPNTVTDIASNGTTFVGAGTDGKIAVSTDNGFTWDPVGSGSIKEVTDITRDNLNSQWIAVTTASSGSPDVLTSPNGNTWTLRTYGENVSLRGVSCADTICVVVGNSGSIRTSPTGVTWTARTSGVATTLRSSAYSSTLGLWVTVGASGVILTSPGSVTWTARTSGTSVVLWRVAWNGTAFVAVGDGGVILRSTDGTTWAPATSGTLDDIYSITVYNGDFYAVGEDGVKVKSEDDGVTWSAWGSATWSCDTKGEVVRSVLADADPKTAAGEWTFTDSIRTPLAEGLYYQPAGGGPMVTIPNGATGQTIISRGEGLMPDWENPQEINAFTTGSTLVSNPVLANTMAKFIRVTDTTWITNGGAFFDNPTADNDSSRFMAVIDRTGYDWSDVASGGGQPLTGGASNGTRLVVCGESGVIRYTDNEGSSWTAATAPVTPVLRSVHWNGAQFLITGDVNASQGTIFTDADGAGTWTRRTTGVPNVGLFRATYNGSRYVVVGSSGTIITSDDAGVTWTARTSGTASNLRGAAWTGTQFVVTGAAGTILTSADGTTWASQTSGVSVQLQSVTYYDGLLVTVGDVSGGTSVILTSTDGITWVRRTTVATNFLFSVNQLGGTFVTGGTSGGNVQVSQDGITWSPVASGATATINAVATTTNNIFVVGGTGAIPGMARKSAGEFRNYVYASSADRTAETGKLDSADVLYTAQPENVVIAGQVDFDVDGLTPPDLPTTFNILRGFKSTPYESNADRAAETDPMGDTMYAYSGTPLVVDVPSLLSFSVAILTPVDVPFNFDVVTIADIIYNLFVVQNSSLNPGPYYGFNAVYDFGVDNRFEYGAESVNEWASLMIQDSDTGDWFIKKSSTAGDAGDPITWVDAFVIHSDGSVTIPSLAGVGTRNVVTDADGKLSAP